MEKERVKKRTSAEKILGRAEKLKKTRNSPKFGTSPLKLSEYDEYMQESQLSNSSLDFLLEGLTHVDLGGETESIHSTSRLLNEEYRESPSTSRDSFSPVGRGIVTPKLPVAMISDDVAIFDDVISDAESDFCPNWSSSDSNVSSAGISEDDVRHDVIIEKERGFSPDIELQFSEESLPSLHDVINLPIPAAGNEQDRSQSSQTANSDGRASPVAKFKPQAIRRVKSMIFEKDNEYDVEKRNRMLMKKHVREITPSQIAMSPSPLLSAEDAGSLKRSPSQLSVKYTLKRSRSNLTMAENYMKRHPIFDGDVIHEESDDDVSDVTTEPDMSMETRNRDVESVTSEKNPN